MLKFVKYFRHQYVLTVAFDSRPQKKIDIPLMLRSSLCIYYAAGAVPDVVRCLYHLELFTFYFYFNWFTFRVDNFQRRHWKRRCS